MFIFETGLEQTDDSALRFARSDQENIRLAALRRRVLQAVDEQLVGRNDRNAAPSYEITAGKDEPGRKTVPSRLWR